MKILVTGSSGLVGSEAVIHFTARDHEVVGVDNNMRRKFFGDAGDTTWMTCHLEETTVNFRHVSLDICDRNAIDTLLESERFEAVIHCAAQPSHDKAAQIPLTDFDVNAVGTINLLEANRQHSPSAPFIYMSTNKVYGDRPNTLPLEELTTRYNFCGPDYAGGIAEDFPIDSSTHSVFGASKVAADIMVQEYGRYFDMPTCCLRGGCLTGPGHSGVELHGFLSYLVKCHITGTPYTVYGYKGKQVRDNIHSRDIATFMERFLEAPKSGAIYNIGGGSANSISIIEAFTRLEKITGFATHWKYDKKNRIGDHICYYSDLTRMRADYPGWDVTVSLNDIFDELAENWIKRQPS